MSAEQSQMIEGFDRFSSTLPGALTIAMLRSGQADPLVLGRDDPLHAWSTIKVPVLVALLTVVRREALTAAQLELARRSITESDNAAILELFALLAGLAGGAEAAAGVIERLFELSGDRGTRVALAPPPPGAVTAFGQTGWSAAGSARFFAALEQRRLLGELDTSYVLGLMEGVIPEQRWGLATLPGSVAIKGGWGPEADGSCLVRQVGVLRRSGTVISLIARPAAPDEGFEVGVGMLNQAAGWLAGRPDVSL